MANRWETIEIVADFIFLCSKITMDGDYSHEYKRCLLLERKVMTNLCGILQSRDITLLTKVCIVKAMVCPAIMYGCFRVVPQRKLSTKNWCLQTVVLEKTLESPLDCKEVNPDNPKGNQSWIFIGRTDAKAEAPKLCPPDMKRQHIGKDCDEGKDWRQKEKRVAEDEMVW